jgi:fibronectin type 3 domain-containing protein
VAAGTSYYYVVTAVDENGIESIFSNEASATIPSP